MQSLQYLTKAHKCEIQSSDWEKDVSSFKEVVKGAIEIAHGMFYLKRTFIFHEERNKYLLSLVAKYSTLPIVFIPTTKSPVTEYHPGTAYKNILGMRQKLCRVSQ